MASFKKLEKMLREEGFDIIKEKGAGTMWGYLTITVIVSHRGKVPSETAVLTAVKKAKRLKGLAENPDQTK